MFAKNSETGKIKQRNSTYVLAIEYKCVGGTPCVFTLLVSLRHVVSDYGDGSICVLLLIMF